MKKFQWIIAVVFSLALGQAAFAHGDWCGGKLENMVGSLNIDEAQKAKLKPVFEELKASLKGKGAQMKELHDQISQQVQSDNMDQGTVDGLVDKKVKLIADMMKAKLKAKNQVINILTPEQKTKIRDMWKKAEERIASKFANCKDE